MESGDHPAAITQSDKVWKDRFRISNEANCNNVTDQNSFDWGDSQSEHLKSILLSKQGFFVNKHNVCIRLLVNELRTLKTHDDDKVNSDASF